jgi:hypothetical protein
LVFLTVAIGLVDAAAAAVADLAGQGVACLLDGELPVDPTPIGVVDWVDHGQQVQGLGDPAVLGEGLAERGWAALAAEHR